MRIDMYIILTLCFLPVLGFGQKETFELTPYLSSGHKAPIDQLEFDHTGRFLSSKDTNSLIIIWDFFSQTEVPRTDELTLAKSENLEFLNSNPVASYLGKKRNRNLIKPQGMGKFVAQLSDNKKKIICWRNSKIVGIIPKIINNFTGLSVNADSSYFAHICDDHFVVIRSVSNLDSFFTIQNSKLITAIAFHPKDEHLLTIGLDDGSIESYDIMNRDLIFTLNNPLTKFEDIQVDYDNHELMYRDESLMNLIDFKTLNAYSYSFFKRSLYNPSDIEKVVLRDPKGNLAEGFLIFNDYGLYSFLDDTLRLAKKFYFNKYSNDMFEALSELYKAPFGIFRTYKERRTESKRENRIEQDKYNLEYYFNEGGEIHRDSITKKRRYFISGSGPVLFGVSEKYLITFRQPDFLLLTDRVTNKKYSYGLEGVTDILTSTNISVCFINVGGSTKVFRMDSGLKLIKTIAGRPINISAESGECFVNRNNELIKIDINTLDEQKLNANQGDNIKYVFPYFLKSEKRGYFILYKNGISSFINISGEKTASCFFHKNGDFLFMTEDNYFFASSKTVLKEMRVEDESHIVYSLSQFGALFNRPDIVLERMNLFDSSVLSYYKQAYSRIGKDKKAFSMGFEVPSSTILEFGDRYYVQDSVLRLHFLFKAPLGQSISNMNVFVNNAPKFDIPGYSILDRQMSSFDTVMEIKLNKGDNYIRPSCTSSSGISSLDHTYFLKASYLNRPNVYFIGIGVGNYVNAAYRLRYPEKDIHDLASLFVGNNDKNNKSFLLTEGVFTIDTLEKIISSLNNININDIVILAYSGHGILDSNGFMLPVISTDFKSPAASSIRYKTIESLIERIPARFKVVFLDACNSGSAGQNENERNLNESKYFIGQDIVYDSTQSTGAVVISAARSGQFALEDSAWNNGAFTYAIKKGIENLNADINNDHVITITELKDYVNKKVIELTHGNQRPISRRDRLDLDWIIWR